MNSASYKGISLIICGAFWFAVMSALGRHLSLHYHPLQVVCLRNVIALALASFFLPKIWQHLVHSRRKNTYVLRGIIGQAATSFWFLAVASIPLVNATAISFLTPVFSTVVAFFLLKEKVHDRRWLQLFIGLVGVIVILHPEASGWQMGYLFALSASLCWAFVNTAIKSLSNTEPPLAMVFMMVLVMSVLSIPVAIPYWKPITVDTYLAIGLLGLSTLLWQISISYAYRHDKVAELQPYEYMRLPFIVIIGVVFFAEHITAMTFVGAAILLGSGFLSRKRKKSKA